MTYLIYNKSGKRGLHLFINRFENGAHQRLSPVGCVKAMWRYATRSASKQKRRLLRFLGY